MLFLEVNVGWLLPNFLARRRASPLREDMEKPDVSDNVSLGRDTLACRRGGSGGKTAFLVSSVGERVLKTDPSSDQVESGFLCNLCSMTSCSSRDPVLSDGKVLEQGCSSTTLLSVDRRSGNEGLLRLMTRCRLSLGSVSWDCATPSDGLSSPSKQQNTRNAF